MSNVVLLEGIYILTAVFAVGITAIESMGLLGDDGDSGHDGGDFGGGDESGDAGGHDGGAAHDAGEHTGDDDASDNASGSEGIVTRGGQWQRPTNPGRYLFKVLKALRLLVYFCLGFGPMGLIAMVLGTGPLLSLGLAIPVGVIACVLYRSLIRFQQRDVDSTVHDRDLVGMQASVLVAIYPNETGRVRVTLSQMVCDRYATSNSNDFIPKGALVDVLATTTDGVVVAMPHEHN